MQQVEAKVNILKLFNEEFLISLLLNTTQIADVQCMLVNRCCTNAIINVRATLTQLRPKIVKNRRMGPWFVILVFVVENILILCNNQAKKKK